MDAVNKIPEGTPLFLKWWIKRAFKKYKLASAKALAKLRDDAALAGVVISLNEEARPIGEEPVENKKLFAWNVIVGVFANRYNADREFILNPPVPFPMSRFQCDTALVWNKRAINALEEKIDRDPFYMFDGDNKIVALCTPSAGLNRLLEEMNEEYAALIKRKATLNKIKIEDIPNKVPAYKVSVLHRIKDMQNV